jgi:hypothetical protein
VSVVRSTLTRDEYLKRRAQMHLCARAKGDLVDAVDPTSRKVIFTREHLFRSSWKEKLVVSVLPDNALLAQEST